MIAGGIIEAGLWQSAVLMGDLKTAYLVQASPKVMFYAQLLGSAIGAFIGGGIYRAFTILHSIPSKEFPVPLAYLWANTSRLASGGELPPGVVACSLAALCISASLRVLSIMLEGKRLKSWVPSGVAISMGTSI